jgi:hypothetical protein
MVIDTFIRQYNFYLQIAFLAVVFASLVLKKQKKFRSHGITMLTAVVLHLISVAAVMIPSYLNLLPLVSEGTLGAPVIAALVHGVIGILTLALAVWIVASWRLRQSLKYCMPKKNAMRVTLVLWVISIVLAVLMYAM